MLSVSPQNNSETHQKYRHSRGNGIITTEKPNGAGSGWRSGIVLASGASNPGSMPGPAKDDSADHCTKVTKEHRQRSSHPDFETHGQSHPKSETEGTSGRTKWILVQQNF